MNHRGDGQGDRSYVQWEVQLDLVSVHVRCSGEGWGTPQMRMRSLISQEECLVKGSLSERW